MGQRLTVQKVTTVVRKTGIGTSRSGAGTGRVRGMSSISYGTTVQANGDVRYICGHCLSADGGHSSGCGWQRHGQRWHRRTVVDGTFTVTLESGFYGFLSGGTPESRMVADAGKIEAALTGAGLAWQAVGDFKWLVSGYAEAA